MAKLLLRKKPKARKKLVKLKKKKVLLRREKEYFMGGHMPDPPEDCTARKHTTPDGRLWVNNGTCHYYCKKWGTCQRAKEYRKLVDQLGWPECARVR